MSSASPEIADIVGHHSSVQVHRTGMTARRSIADTCPGASLAGHAGPDLVDCRGELRRPWAARREGHQRTHAARKFWAPPVGRNWVRKGEHDGRVRSQVGAPRNLIPRLCQAVVLRQQAIADSAAHRPEAAKSDRRRTSFDAQLAERAGGTVARTAKFKRRCASGRISCCR